MFCITVSHTDKRIVGEVDEGEGRYIPRCKTIMKQNQFSSCTSRFILLNWCLHNEGAWVSKNLRNTFWKTGRLDPATDAEEMDSFSSNTSASPHLYKDKNRWGKTNQCRILTLQQWNWYPSPCPTQPVIQKTQMTSGKKQSFSVLHSVWSKKTKSMNYNKLVILTYYLKSAVSCQWDFLLSEVYLPTHIQHPIRQLTSASISACLFSNILATAIALCLPDLLQLTAHSQSNVTTASSLVATCKNHKNTDILFHLGRTVTLAIN